MFLAKRIKMRTVEADDPVELFLRESQPAHNFVKEVCFYRIVGMDCDDSTYVKGVLKIDSHFRARPPESRRYIRLNSLRLPTPADDLSKYTRIYETWREAGKGDPQTLFKMTFPFVFQDETMEWTLKQAFHEILDVYKANTKGVTESMLHNFGVKALYWLEVYLPYIFSPSAKTTDAYPKLLYVGNVKKQECLFLHFLALLGCDVLYLNPEQDIPHDYRETLAISRLCTIGVKKSCATPIPEFIPEKAVQTRRTPPPSSPPVTAVPAAAPAPLVQTAQTARVEQGDTQRGGPDARQAGRELSYEELACLSAAVVMIKILDDEGKYCGSGSGVVISRQGYILTNFHVVCGGRGFVVQFENDDQEYWTNELIKYHQDYDLALLKVEQRPSMAIEVLKEEKLVRGQKVVAIGSPLGLFNTVSDGIISGFRQFERSSMIQFTAPTSRGSSGGALLDMRGRLVGLVTGGLNDGQNINLAVDNATIYNFVQNFLNE